MSTGEGPLFTHIYRYNSTAIVSSFLMRGTTPSWGAFVSFWHGRSVTLMEQRTRAFAPLWTSTASSVAETQWVTGWN